MNIFDQMTAQRESAHLRIAANFTDSPLNKSISFDQFEQEYLSKGEEFSCFTPKAIENYVNDLVKGADPETKDQLIHETTELIKGMEQVFVQKGNNVDKYFVQKKVKAEVPAES